MLLFTRGQKDKAVIGTNNGKLGPVGNIQASFWSFDKSTRQWMDGKGAFLGRIHNYPEYYSQVSLHPLSPRGNKSHPMHVRSFYFPRPHPSGCLPSLQALRCRQENISLFSHAWFQQSILSLYLQLNWSSGLVEQRFHQSWAPL